MPDNEEFIRSMENATLKMVMDMSQKMDKACLVVESQVKSLGVSVPMRSMLHTCIMELVSMQKTGMGVRLRGAIRFVPESIRDFTGRRGSAHSHSWKTRNWRRNQL